MVLYNEGKSEQRGLSSVEPKTLGERILENLYCTFLLRRLDLSGCISLEHLLIQYCSIEHIDLSSLPTPKIVRIESAYYKPITVDLTGCVNIRSLHVCEAVTVIGRH